MSPIKTIRIFIIKACPACKRALLWMEELKKENAKYRTIDIEIIDETIHPAIANQYDYYYVPTFYIDGAKIHEGDITKDILQKIFEQASE